MSCITRVHDALPRNMTLSTLNILTAEEVIAVNQDPLGVAGDLVWQQGPVQVCWPLT